MESRLDKNKVVRSSVQVVLTNDDGEPQCFGSGFIGCLAGKKFFISVRHVADREFNVCVDPCKPTSERRAPLIPIGGIYYYNLYKLGDDPTEAEVEALFSGPGEEIDIVFAELKTELDLFQIPIVFGETLIEYSPKLEVSLDQIGTLDKIREYGFYGAVKQEIVGNTLQQEYHLKNALKFHRSSKKFDIFLNPTIIPIKEEFQGCSGAPILDDDGLLVGVACKVVTPSQMVYSFPIEECIRLINLSMDIEKIDSRILEANAPKDLGSLLQ